MKREKGVALGGGHKKTRAVVGPFYPYYGAHTLQKKPLQKKNF